MSVKISSYRPAKKGFCLGFVSFTIEKYFMFFNDVAIFEKNGNKWLNFPSRKYEVDGETKYMSYCGFTSKEVKVKFEKTFFQALDKYIAENPSKPTELASKERSEDEEDNCPF